MRVRLGKICLTPRGQYSSSTTYERLDLVRSGANAYVSLSDGNTGNPVTDTNKWMMLVNGDYLLTYIETHGLTTQSLTVTDSATIGGNLTVDGNALFDTNVFIDGDLTVLGSFSNATLETRLAAIEESLTHIPSGGGGGGGGGSASYADMAGGLTASVWSLIDAKDSAAIASTLEQVANLYVPKTLWNRIFELRDSNGNVLSIDGNLSDLATIVAKYDFASTGGVSALGTGGSGGGGGGGNLSAPLSLLNGIGNPSGTGNYGLRWNASTGVYTWIAVGSGGEGDTLVGALSFMNGDLMNPSESGTYNLTYNSTTQKYSWSTATGDETPLNALLTSLNNSGLAAPTSAEDGMTLVYRNDISSWVYGTTGTTPTQGVTLSEVWASFVGNSGSYQNNKIHKGHIPTSLDTLTVGRLTASTSLTVPSTITTSGNKTLTMPSSNGTLALLSDIPSPVTSLAWSAITSKPDTLSGYGITDAKIQNGTITLGSNTITPITSVTPNTASAGQVVTHATVSGGTVTLQRQSISSVLYNSELTWWGRGFDYNSSAITGNMYNVGSVNMDNNSAIYIYDSNSNALNLLTLNTSNVFALGYGARLRNYTTDIQGGTINFAVNGNVGGNTDNRIDALNISSNGCVWVKQATQGLRIGDGLLTWDATNNALKVSKSDGTAAHLYALGGISALGFNSGSGSTNSATIGTLNVTGQLNMATETRISTPEDLYIGNDHSEGYVYMADMASQAGANKWRFGEEGTLFVKNSISVGTDVSSKSGYTGGFIQSPRFYLDNTRYLYLSGNVLMYFDGLTDRTVAMS